MDNKNYMRNSEFFDKSGRRRPGIISQSIPQKRQKEDPSKEDRENRGLVISKIIELISQGMTKEDACRQIAEDENITSKFKYLFGEAKEKRSEDEINKIAQIYANWHNGKTRERRGIENPFGNGR